MSDSLICIHQTDSGLLKKKIKKKLQKQLHGFFFFFDINFLGPFADFVQNFQA